jgi:hypothetical protein
MTAVALAPAPTPTDEPAYHSVTAAVTDGLDGALRVLTLLRGRRYRVRDLEVRVDEGRVTCTVLLSRADLDLMLARLRRLPAVVSAVG